MAEKSNKVVVLFELELGNTLSDPKEVYDFIAPITNTIDRSATVKDWAVDISLTDELPLLQSQE